MTHAELCKLALDWLKRPASRGGHGCQLAIDECRTGWGGEVPDALGYRCTGRNDDPEDGTVLVECKVSRSDFVADRSKPHRQAGGVGNWRYFLAPEGLIGLDELPEKWGLVEVNARGHLKLRRGVYTDTNYLLRRERLLAMRHQADFVREMFLVVRLYGRIQDSDKLAEIGKERNRLAFRLTDVVNELRLSKAHSQQLGYQLRELQDELQQLRAPQVAT
ncbi:hypothetical protein CBP36_21035 (plasmid) [Acidovorax carolinensis]|uniref:Adenylosuccinate synthase n=1 Tax=Acidovorax carolinensis TaxID=553814 RepID=A0A240UK14_9BURK|nr:hypothetical protein [Acidovorax carolinensis]ART61455.1 hypothetical protein CBP36_21035 [Acidovorax carolinensis]